MKGLLKDMTEQVVRRGELEALRRSIVADIESGKVLVPVVRPSTPNLAGGVNHHPNSDVSYSLMAATVAATTPAAAGDDNQEAYKFYWAERGADVVLDDAHALKAVGHSLYAAGEGATPGIPVWDRVNGWVEYGSEGATQYDIVVVLPLGLVGAGQRWHFRLRCGALESDVLPDDVQAFAGFWHDTAAGEGWVEGTAFDISHEVKGTPGATSINYRVLAQTDGGVQILSNVLNVPNANAALDDSNYVKLFFNPGPGFITFDIYKEVGGVFRHVFQIRNSSDFQYNDTGLDVFGVVAGWPAVTQAAPQAYAVTRTLLVGAFGGEWQPDDLTIQVPPAYDYTETTALYLRYGLTAATGVDRHVGLDRFVLSTTYHEWAPDDPHAYASGPSISPTSGSQGAGGGVFEPPEPGTGGRTCVAVNTPVLVSERGRRVFKQYQSVRRGAELIGEERLPYVALEKKQGLVSEYLIIKTANGVTLKCSVDHELALSLSPRRRIRAENVAEGTRLACRVGGRKTFTTVVSVKLVPRAAAVGTFVLRHAGGLYRDGDGMYVAGESTARDRGLYCFNEKNLDL